MITQTGVLIWYMILTGYHGGVVAVPQVGHSECVQQATWVNNNLNDVDHNYQSAYCVQGLK